MLKDIFKSLALVKTLTIVIAIATSTAASYIYSNSGQTTHKFEKKDASRLEDKTRLKVTNPIKAVQRIDQQIEKTVALAKFSDDDEESRSNPLPYRLQLRGNKSTIRLTLNKSDTIQTQEVYSTALIGNSEIADVIPLSEQSLYLIGKKIGTTRLTVLDKNKKIIGIVEVEVSYDLEQLQQQFTELLPNAQITVKSINGKILLTGTVPDSQSLQQAIAISREIAPKSVTSTLAVASPQQVMLEVRFIEANRETTKDLGVGWNVVANKFVGATLLNNVATNTLEVGQGIARLLQDGLISNNTPFGTAVARLLNNGVKADLIIQALEKKNLARRLAEPNLIALSGDKAYFLAGGEFPFPVPGENNVPSIQFKKFGVGLTFTPYVLKNGLINLRIEPEVSELVPTNSISVAGTVVPSILIRKAKTTVELRDGQSFAIAGLLQSNNIKLAEQLPWIGDVPVVGSLFRSSSFQKNETDLVIIVTPRLVKPAVPGQVLATPLDSRVAANDVEFFLNGKQEIKPNKPEPYKGHLLRSDKSVDYTEKKYKEEPEIPVPSRRYGSKKQKIDAKPVKTNKPNFILPIRNKQKKEQKTVKIQREESVFDDVNF